MHDNAFWWGCISKLLKFILRFNPDNLHMHEDGFVSVDELLQSKSMTSMQVTFADIVQVVRDDNKQKPFSLLKRDQESDIYWIRANHGHGIHTPIQSNALLTRITKPLPVCVHGTYERNWKSIERRGLSRQARKHIHFSAHSPQHDMSAMRRNCNIAIYVDMALAMRDGIVFYQSENGIILTEGWLDTGSVPANYFSRVEHLQKGEVGGARQRFLPVTVSPLSSTSHTMSTPPLFMQDCELFRAHNV